MLKLFQLMAAYIPVELKASLLDAIAAFVVGGFDQSTRAIKYTVWQLIDECQILAGGGNGGIFADLEVNEARECYYPETLSFMRLLNELVRGSDVYEWHDTQQYRSKYVAINY